MTDKTNAWPSIKDHPLIIVLGFCAATAAATATVYEKIVMPYQVKVLENQVSDLNRQLTSIPNTEKTIAERDADIAKLRTEIATLKQRLLELTKENVFSDDDPYPKAFRRIRVGDLFSKLEETYPGQVTKSDPENTYASINPDDFFFSSITYYYDETSKPLRVSQILFHLKKDIPSGELYKTSDLKSINKILNESAQAYVGALKTQLTERYGQGKAGKRETTWRVKGLLLTLKENGLFLISKP